MKKKSSSKVTWIIAIVVSLILGAILGSQLFPKQIYQQINTNKCTASQCAQMIHFNDVGYKFKQFNEPYYNVLASQVCPVSTACFFDNMRLEHTSGGTYQASGKCVCYSFD